MAANRLPRVLLSPRQLAFGLAVVTVFGIGIVERWMLFARTFTTSDEAIVVLMGRSVFQGHFPLFYWGQQYGGTPEILPVGIITEIFGYSLVAQRMFSILLGAASCWLAWLIANRLMGRGGAWMAASILWLWPIFFVGWSLREFDFYTPTIALGLFALWAAIRGWDHPASRWLPCACGVAAGLAWWMGPNVAVFAVPVVFALMRLRNHRWNRLVWSVGGFLLGALPWFIYSAQHHFVTLHAGANARPGSYSQRLRALLHDGGPVMLGLKHDTRLWVGGHWAHILYALLLVTLAGVCVIVLLAGVRRAIVLPVDMIGLVCYPFVYALSPTAGTPTLFVARYYFFGWPFVAFAAARLVTVPEAVRALRGPPRRIGLKAPAPVQGLAMAVAVVLGCLALVQTEHEPTVATPNYPLLVRSLQAHGVHDAFASYWQAYLIDVAADGRVLVSAPDFDRTPQWEAQVEGSRDPAWIFLAGSPDFEAFEAWRHAQPLPMTEFSTTGFIVVVPAQKLLPARVPPTSWPTS